MNKLRILAASMVLASTMTAMAPAQAIALRTGFGGPEGYGELTQNPNDDESSNQLNLPFAIDFFGSTYNQFFVNNNGNITFNSALGSFTPSPFPITNQPTIAPFWADVDTRNQPGGGAVYVASPNADTVVVTWHNVGYYSSNNDKLNDFQLTLQNRSDTGVGNFDIEFRYNQLQWTTGDASGGTGGLGGTPAQAGYDAGNGTNFFVLPGSFSSDVLDLADTSNVSAATPGLWTMSIRNGGTSDGSSAGNPLLPVIVDDSGAYQFEFNVDLNQRVFIDPVVAVGYEYIVSAGPNILTALFPTIPGDVDGYDIFSLSDVLLGHVAPGGLFDFGVGVSGFRLMGIDTGAALDPNNPTAFVTGLTFDSAGNVQMSQRPITADTGNNVPEPPSLALLLLAMAAMAGVVQRAQRH